MREIFKTSITRCLIVLLSIALFWMALTGCLPRKEKKEVEEKKKEVKVTEEEEKEREEKPKTMMITLYFGDEQAEYLLPEKRGIPKTEAIARSAIEELIKGPKESGHFPTIPEGTRLLGIRIEDGIAHVDFSEELVERHPGGSAGETMTIYSIVSTLVEFPTIQRVKFLVEGREIKTLAGHMDLTEPIAPDPDLIRR
ncbi:MAG: GerMN domain-containing protein [Actinomycetota bacterium]|nr:GerMN domain-containing protein [Actinomycetota bacterium]MDI6821901.1 GerMN domain-containing protein [Actinomycetota bacterium]